MIRLCAFSDEYGNKLEEQIEGLKLNNIHLIEIRNVDGKNVLNFTDEEAKYYYEELLKNDIRVWSIGSPLGKVDIDVAFEEYKNTVLKRLCELANIFQTSRIRMFSFFKAYEKKDEVIKKLQEMVNFAKKYNVELYHENEKDIYGDSLERVLELKQNVQGLKFVYDPANFIQCEQNPDKTIDSLFDKMDYFHIKDIIEGSGEIVPAGKGDCKIDRILKLIDNKNVTLTIEPHLSVFPGYSEIDKTELKNKFVYKNNKEAFNAACLNLKNLLKEKNYAEYKDGFIKKYVRYGVIGLGNMGSGHIANFMKEGNIPFGEVVAIADRKQEKIDRIKNLYPNHTFECYLEGSELIEHGNVEAVIIAVPHYQHPELTILALKKNINVICEKPAGVYTKQVKEMIEVSKNSHALFTMMFNQRTNCVYRKMREIVTGGEIGEVKRVNWIITDWYRSQSYFDSGDWRATWEGEGGGVLFNQSQHQLDLLAWVVGMMPKRLQAFCHFGKWHNIEVEDDVTCYLEYENGATGVFVTSTADAPGTNRFEVLGTGGKIVCENDKLKLYKNEIDERKFNQEYKGGFGSPKFEEIEVETDGENLQHTGICRNFTNAILGIEPLFVDGKEGLKSVELMDAMLMSTWLNKMIELPIDDEKYYELLLKQIKNSKIHKNVEEKILDTKDTYNGSK